MKNIIFLLITLTAFAAIGFGQQKAQTAPTKWTRVESDDKSVSVAFPADFLIDAKTKRRDQQYRLFGFENGVTMELKISEPDNPKKNLEWITAEPSEYIKLSALNFNGIAGKNYITKRNRYTNAYHFALEDEFYTFSIAAPNENKAEIN